MAMDMPDVYWVSFKNARGIEYQQLMEKTEHNGYVQYLIFGYEVPLEEREIISAIPVKIELQHLTESLPE